MYYVYVAYTDCFGKDLHEMLRIKTDEPDKIDAYIAENYKQVIDALIVDNYEIKRVTL